MKGFVGMHTYTLGKIWRPLILRLFSYEIGNILGTLFPFGVLR